MRIFRVTGEYSNNYTMGDGVRLSLKEQEIPESCGVVISLLVGWFLNILVNNYAISRAGPKTDI